MHGLFDDVFVAFITDDGYRGFQGLALFSPFLTGRMFVREPGWEYSANLVGS